MRYIDVQDLWWWYDRLSFRAPVIVQGAKGTGKSLSLRAWAEVRGVQVVTCDCSEDLRRSHLVGQFTLKGGESPFVPGPLLRAISLANNEPRGCLLVLEEINALNPIAQKVLNPLTDWRRNIYVPELEKEFTVTGHLWVVGTANHAYYGGVYALNEDLNSRFRFLSVNYPSFEQEQRILTELGLKSPYTKGVLRWAMETRVKKLGYALSTRDVVQILEDEPALGISNALLLAVGKFPEDERPSAHKRLSAIFPSYTLPNTRP